MEKKRKISKDLMEGDCLEGYIESESDKDEGKGARSGSNSNEYEEENVKGSTNNEDSDKNNYDGNRGNSLVCSCILSFIII